MVVGSGTALLASPEILIDKSRLDEFHPFEFKKASFPNGLIAEPGSDPQYVSFCLTSKAAQYVPACKNQL